MKRKQLEIKNATEILLGYFSPYFVFPEFYLKLLKESDPNFISSLLCLNDCVELVNFKNQTKSKDEIFDIEESIKRYWDNVFEMENKCAVISNLMKYKDYDFFKYVMNTTDLCNQIRKIDHNDFFCPANKLLVEQQKLDQFLKNIKLKKEVIQEFEKIRPEQRSQQ